MIAALFNVYLVILFLLVRLKIVRFSLFWKCSPLIVLLLLMFGLFIPMGLGRAFRAGGRYPQFGADRAERGRRGHRCAGRAE